MESLTLPAPAKINLFLHILGRRADQYHNIQTLFQFVDFSDVLTFAWRDDKQIQVHTNNDEIITQQNLVLRAAHELQHAAKVQEGINIHLNKRIPIGAGLGGGSSDAATTLLALNYLWKLNWSLDQLASLGKKLGADIPVFIHGHAAWAEGIGDELIAMVLPEPWYLLMIPSCRVQTTNIYQDSRLNRDSERLNIETFHFDDGHNDFEKIIRMDYPEVARALEWLDQFSHAKMTGSGSVVFAAFDTREEASRIAALVPAGFQSVVAKGLNYSPLHTALSI